MEPTKRDILTLVAEGKLTPEEAAARLDEAPQTDHDIPSRGPDAPSAEGAPIRRVRVIGDFRTAHITGDPEVTGATADGPHAARQEGETLIIDARHDESGDTEGFRFSRGHRPRVIIGIGTRPEPVSVRMNPDLPLEVDIDAGSASINGVRAPIKAHIDAGNVRVNGAESPFDLSVDAGSVAVVALLADGESKINCDAGSVKVSLKPGSSVRVRATSDIGKVRLGDRAQGGFGIGEHLHEDTIGGGRGLLDIRTAIGKISVEYTKQ